jgi:hypothetical protein
MELLLDSTEKSLQGVCLAAAGVTTKKELVEEARLL